MDINKLRFDSDKILSSLRKKDKEHFLSFTKKLTFKKGKLVFYEGGIATGVFLIKSGRAKIFNTGIYGKVQIFYIYKRGDLLGYHALLCNEAYEDSCEALEDCEILFISKTDFEHLLHTIPSLKLLLIQNMSHEFGVLVNTITILAQRTLRERLALYLLILNERYYNEETKQAIINLRREDLANIIGTARESLGRLLKDFKEEKLIQIDKRTIKISNVKELNKIANAFN
ncbi:MAG: CRP-like cAMP-binding protein [Saprospiraceae bacterium]|jgi:CRP-like cAMP-binding protein